jgi:hypothetical protein
MLGLIDTLQDQSIGILTRHGIVPSGVGALRWRIKDGDPQGNKLGVELVDVCTAIHMKGKMVKPWRIAVILPPFARAPGTFERDGEHAVRRIGDGPTRHCRRAGLHGDSAVAQQGQDGIIKGHCAVRISNSEVEMAQGSTDHEVLRLI